MLRTLDHVLRPRNPNRQYALLHSAIFGVVLILFGGLAYWQVFRSDLANDENNPRLIQSITSPYRGSILDRDGNVLAASAEDGTRQYFDASLAHVLGYISPRFGAEGIERAYNDVLTGEAGQTWSDALNAEFERNPDIGADVQLTIDPVLQAAAANALGGAPGSVVVLDPDNGDVLAMVSYPTFDPARIIEGDESLFDDPTAPLLNRATQGLYPPGSTFKTVTATGVLENNVVDPDTMVTCQDEFVVEGFAISCHNVVQGEGTYPFADAFTFSVNAIFAQVGLELGWDRLIATARDFGFGSPLPFTIDTAATQVHDPGATLTQPLLASTAFGQGQLLATPLQMAVVAATVANGGVLEEPHLGLRAIKDGETVADLSNRSSHRVMDGDTAETMRQLMGTVITQGQAYLGVGAGIPAGGKTGTAETGRGTSHAWFIGFAPLEEPQIAVAVIVEDGGQGGSVAAPIAGAVMLAAMNEQAP
jgi:peptidoglycan glycosyltransferase